MKYHILRRFQIAELSDVSARSENYLDFLFNHSDIAMYSRCELYTATALELELIILAQVILN